MGAEQTQVSASFANGSPQALREQMYRYAQDLNELMDQHGQLQQRYQMAQHSLGRARLGNDLLIGNIRYGDMAYLVTDGTGTLTRASEGTEPLLGQSVKSLRGVNLLQLTPENRREDLAALLSQLSRHDNSAIVYCQLDLFNSLMALRIDHFDVLIVPLQKYDDLSFFWLLHKRLPDETDDLRALQGFDLLHASDCGLMIVDANGNICTTNPAFTRMTGYNASEVNGHNPRMLSSGRHSDDFYHSFFADLHKEGSWSGEFFNRRKNWQIYPERKTVKEVKNVTGQTLFYVAVMVDSSRRYNDTEQLSYLAYHDGITGLPNRLLLEDRLDQSLSRAQRDGDGLSLLFIDLDNFKPINDEFGQKTSDLVLQEVGKRLKCTVRNVDTAARIGGGEFVILIQGSNRKNNVEAIVSALLSALSVPVLVGEHKLLVCASIGCALYPHDGDDAATLLKNAGSAMSLAKRNVGRHFCFFDMGVEQIASASLGMDLWHAVDRGEMHVVFQPQVTEKHQLSGFEALLRWNHPTLGEVSPMTFITIAEINGTILQLGEWVLETACRQLRLLHDAGMPKLTMSVKVSPRQLRDPDFASKVSQILLTTGVAANAVELEILETAAQQCKDDEGQSLQTLSALGIKLAVDNFGTGFFNLSRLQNMPVNRLIIDRSLVNEIVTSARARAISHCFVNMSTTMGMEVVAKGVETSEQFQVLSDQGCQLIQGYFAGRPMTASDLQALIAEN